LEKQSDIFKTALKIGIDQNFKESDPKNTTKDPKSVGKLSEKGKTKKAAQSI